MTLTLHKPLVILKFGGSILTIDSQFETFNEKVASQLLSEISALSTKFNFVLVHGAGSFGHYHAKEYDLKNGLKNDSQLVGVVKTHNSMLKLNSLFLSLFEKYESLKPISFNPMTLCKTENGEIKSFYLDSIQNALQLGLTPILFGDVVFDEVLDVTILSGDKIVPYLALALETTKIVMLTDVEGVYDDNPKKNPKAKLLQEINLNNKELLKKISANASSGKTRVTGEMEKKLLELEQVVKNGVETWIISGLKEQVLYSKLATNDQNGTKIVVK